MVGRYVRALLVGALVALAGLLVPSPAAAAGDYLDVEITGVSSAVLDLTDPDQVVELTGTLTNTSTDPIRYVNVHFWRLDLPITTPEQLDAYTRDAPLGARLIDEAAGNLDILTREEGFQPGERADFTVRATVGQLTQGSYPFTTDDAAYLLGVQVRGIPQVGGNQVVGEDQVVVVATDEPVESSAVVELTAPVTWLPDGQFTDDSLAADLTERLELLLAAAEREGAVAAVDPALLDAVDQMTGPHIVDGVEVAGSGVAIGWLERVLALEDEDRLWRLPYGAPDLVRARDAGVLARTWEASLDATSLRWLSLPLVAVIGAGGDADLAAQLGGAEMVLVRDAAGAEDGSPAMLGSTSTADVTALPPGVRAGRLLADELLARRAPIYLISDPSDDGVDRLAEEARARVAPSAEPSDPLTWQEGTGEEPWTAVTDALDEAAGNAEFQRQLMGADAAEDLTALEALAFSSGFDDEDAAVAYVEANTPAPVDPSQVSLSAVQSFVMGSRTNMFPATITNDLDFPVQVMVTFESDAPQRISVPNIGPVTVGPGESATVDITPEATANGVTLVHARLTTLDGAPLGAPVAIEITATDFGRVGWIIIVASGAVVVGGSALRIRAVQRERALKGEP